MVSDRACGFMEFTWVYVFECARAPEDAQAYFDQNVRLHRIRPCTHRPYKHLLNGNWCCFCCQWLVIASEKLISLEGNEIRRIDLILMAFIIPICSMDMDARYGCLYAIGMNLSINSIPSHHSKDRTVVKFVDAIHFSTIFCTWKKPFIW